MTPTARHASEELKDLCTKAATDEAFASHFQSNPKEVLRGAMIEVPDHVEIKVVRDDAATKYLHIPMPPMQGELSDQDLSNVHGGTTFWCGAGAVISVLSVTSVSVNTILGD